MHHYQLNGLYTLALDNVLGISQLSEKAKQMNKKKTAKWTHKKAYTQTKYKITAHAIDGECLH